MRTTKSIFLALTLMLSLSSPVLAKDKGGGGGGGGGGGSGGGGVPAPVNPFVGEWIGGPDVTFTLDQAWDIIFNKNDTFSAVILDRITGINIRYTCTYDYSLVAPDSFPVLTMVSQGRILLQMEYFFYDGAMIFERGSGPFMEFGKKPDAN
jgi:hypothetical protein